MGCRGTAWVASLRQGLHKIPIMVLYPCIFGFLSCSPSPLWSVRFESRQREEEGQRAPIGPAPGGGFLSGLVEYPFCLFSILCS